MLIPTTDEGSGERREGNGRGEGKREEKGREREGRGEGKEGKRRGGERQKENKKGKVEEEVTTPPTYHHNTSIYTSSAPSHFSFSTGTHCMTHKRFHLSFCPWTNCSLEVSSSATNFPTSYSDS